MPINVRVVVLLAAVLMAGCGLHSDDNTANGPNSGGRGILTAMRPGADPALIERLNQEEKMRAQAQAQEQSNAQATAPESLMSGLGRILPRVSTDPIAPPAEQVSQSGAVDASEDGAAVVEPVNAPSSQTNQSVASYAPVYYGSVPPPPPGAVAAGLVPPPFPVTLSTQAQTYSGVVPEGAYNPYANPYAAYQAQVQPVVPQQRPPGLFGSGSSGSSSDDGEAHAAGGRRQVAFNPITPTGMDSRSQFKQRDDLKILWKGAINQSIYLGGLAGDNKFLAELNRVQVGLPPEATKGNFSVSARQTSAIFRSAALDKRMAPTIHKLESELLQSYYRYIYTYNKFCFAQQTVAARKQEVDLANSAAEQQRATADLSQAQRDLEAAKEDMRSAQVELAQASSPTAARAVIAKVSNLTPSLESLQSDTRDSNSASGKIAMFGSMFNPIGSFFKLGHGKTETKKEQAKESEDLQPNEAIASEFEASVEPANGKAKKRAKEKERIASEKTSKAKLKIVEQDSMPDLTPAPREEREVRDEAPAKESPITHPSSFGTSHDNTAVSFTLKGVNVSARKSVLTVAIKNAGADAFNFSPDLISVAEGSHRLSDAATRADFDATQVQPNEEVKGTITIFGRPWSDKLTVCISEGRKAIQMRRQ